jgi:hypothetical protein
MNSSLYPTVTPPDSEFMTITSNKNGPEMSNRLTHQSITSYLMLIQLASLSSLERPTSQLNWYYKSLPGGSKSNNWPIIPGYVQCMTHYQNSGHPQPQETWHELDQWGLQHPSHLQKEEQSVQPCCWQTRKPPCLPTHP